ncbi:MAG: hypothetical protein ACXIUB_02720 [Wenzhouxiangella sp.]
MKQARWLGAALLCPAILVGCASPRDHQAPSRQAAPVEAHYEAGSVITRQRLEFGLEAGVFDAFQAARQHCQDQGYRGAREFGPSEPMCLDDNEPCGAYLIQRRFECTGGFRPVLDRRNI